MWVVYIPRGSRATGALSTLELVIALALAALVLGLVVPRLSPRPLHLTADAQELSANLEIARALALSRTTHYRLRVVNATQYAVDRGAFAGGAWTFPVTERTVRLRANIALAAGDLGKAVEFDSRGRVVGAEVTFTLVDGTRGWSRQIRVRTTGMVESP